MKNLLDTVAKSLTENNIAFKRDQHQIGDGGETIKTSNGMFMYTYNDESILPLIGPDGGSFFMAKRTNDIDLILSMLIQA